MASDDVVVVKIPKDLADRIGRETGRRFPSVDDSIVYLLEEALKNRSLVPSPDAEFSPEEKKAIEERLKSLGYL